MSEVNLKTIKAGSRSMLGFCMWVRFVSKCFGLYSRHYYFGAPYQWRI